jgi:lysophospholipase L1-like esterase
VSFLRVGGLSAVVVTLACGGLPAPVSHPDAGEADPPRWFVRDAGVRILPLGDSITEGATAELGGYRWPLFNLMVDAGVVFEFVGSLRTGSPVQMPQPWHEGHGGYQVESDDGGAQLEGAVVEAALGTYHPDVILLLAGTNDLYWPDTGNPEKTSAEYARLLAQIFALSPDAGVIASPVPWKLNVPSGQVAAFNAHVEAVVDGFADAGYRVAWVAGMTDAVDAGPENLTDGIHPSQPAYERMAEQWFDVLNAVTTP